MRKRQTPSTLYANHQPGKLTPNRWSYLIIQPIDPSLDFTEKKLKIDSKQTNYCRPSATVTYSMFRGRQQIDRYKQYSQQPDTYFRVARSGVGGSAGTKPVMESFGLPTMPTDPHDNQQKMLQHGAVQQRCPVGWWTIESGELQRIRQVVGRFWAIRVTGSHWWGRAPQVGRGWRGLRRLVTSNQLLK